LVGGKVAPIIQWICTNDILSARWMNYMTSPTGTQRERRPGYGATMWLSGPKQGSSQVSYAAQGNRRQYVMIIPSKKLPVVRRGDDAGAARFRIAKFAADIAASIE
jgi:CubicO group peptidase (beta-lactamase class C family)